MDACMLGVAGPIASGKSALSKALARTFGWSRVGFGDYVRAQARARGLEETRGALQALGETLPLEQGWQTFCRGTLRTAAWTAGTPVLVDGIRHLEAFDALRSLAAPLPFRLLFVNTDDAVRMERLRARGAAVEDMRRTEEHSTEVQVRRVLLAMAGLVVDGSRPLPELIEEVCGWLAATSRR